MIEKIRYLILALAILLLAGGSAAQAAETTAVHAPAEHAAGTTMVLTSPKPAEVVAPAEPAKASAQPPKASVTTPAASAPKSAPAKTPAPAIAPVPSMSAATAELGGQLQALVTGGQENVDLEPQETFGTRALGLILTFMQVLNEQGSAFLIRVGAWPQLSAWFVQQITVPALADRWVSIGARLIIVLGGSILAGAATSMVLMPLRRRIKRRETSTLAARISVLTAWLLVSLVPLIIYLGAAGSLIEQGGDVNKIVRFIVMTFVYAFAVFLFVRLMVRYLVSPNTPHLRMIPMSTNQAHYIQKWMNWFSGVMIVGFFMPDVARVVRVPAPAISLFNNLVGLLVVMMTMTIILQKRAVVSSFLRGDLWSGQHDLTLWQSLRLWLARIWHVLAISYLVIGYIVTTLSSGGGFAIMQQGTILTLLVLLGMRFMMYIAARIGTTEPKTNTGKSMGGILRPVLQGLIRFAAWVSGVAGVAAAWGADVTGLVMSPWGQRVFGSVFSITATILLVVVIYEAIHVAIGRKLNKKDETGQVIVNARAQTLLPMLHNAAIIILAVIVGLVTLSELGINIAPLLAGAGVLGVAVGFGSQTLVKDFLTGLFIILEDTIAVGDNVAIGEHAGVVEGMTIRTLRLRDMAGNLHILPFSEITKLINKTKGFSYALIDVGVAYNSDLDQVMEVLRQTGDEIMKDPIHGPAILASTEVLGVENLGDSSITIRCRIKTRPGSQWDIKRLFLLHIKKRFDEEGIEIPFPTVMHIRRTENTVKSITAVDKDVD